MKNVSSFLKKKAESAKKDLVFGISKKKLPSWQQLRYLYTLLSHKERIVYQVALSLVVVCAVFMGGAFYFLNTEVVAQDGGDYTEGLVGYPEYVNPILAQANDVDLDLSSLIFSSLFKYNSQQELIPDLVTNYVLSEDQKTYTFYLRSDAKWHDGEDLLADDVIFTIQSIQDKTYKSPLRSSLSGVQIQKLDDHSFSLTLKEPFAPFLSSLTFGILPEHRWFDIPAQNFALAEDNLKPIGSGPYKFSSLIKDRAGLVKSYHLEVNKDYYDEKPHLKEVNFLFYADIYSAVEAAKQKKVEGLSFIPAEDKEALEHKNSNLIFHSLRLPQYTAIFFNQKKSDILSKDPVREALIWGVDQDKIVTEVLQGDGENIYTPILPGYLGYNPETEKYGLDIEKGKEILEEAGWSIPEGEQYYKKNDNILEFTIATVELAEYMETLEILKENWEAMGFKINVDVYSVEDIQNQVIKPREYEALLFGEIIGTDPDPYPFWHSSQMNAPGLALAIFHQKDIDSLLEEARKITDEEERRLKYLHFQNIIAEEIPAIFLFNPSYSYSVHKKIKGIDSLYITVPSDRFAGIEDWHIKTKRTWKKDSTTEVYEEPEVVEVPVEDTSSEEENNSEEETQSEE